MTYHITKNTRGYHGLGYAGISCQQAGIEPAQTYATLDAAIADAKKLSAVNPVGWQVVDAETRQIVRIVQGE